MYGPIKFNVCVCVRGVYILILARAITQIINDSIFSHSLSLSQHEMEMETERTEHRTKEKTTPTIKNEFKTIKSSVDVKGTNYLLSMILLVLLLLLLLLFLFFGCVCVWHKYCSTVTICMRGVWR